jgi:hypothetical protein
LIVCLYVQLNAEQGLVEKPDHLAGLIPFIKAKKLEWIIRQVQLTIKKCYLLARDLLLAGRSTPGLY